MSLTLHLRNPNSPATCFLRQRFPAGRSVWPQCPRIAQHRMIPPASKVHAGTIGSAFDYRLRHYFPPVPSERLIAAQLLSFISHDRIPLVSPTEDGRCAVEFPEQLADGFLTATDAAVRELQPAGRRLAQAEEERLARHCVVLALFEQVYRAGLWPGSPLARVGRGTVSDLLAVPEQSWVDDVCASSWGFHDELGELLSHQATLNPHFDGSGDVGGADADLIIDDCLIDVKTTSSASYNTMWLRQLMGYVLLDYSDRHHIGSLGLYLARRRLFVRWPLGELMVTMAGSMCPPVGELRRQFRQVAEEARQERLAPRFVKRELPGTTLTRKG